MEHGTAPVGGGEAVRTERAPVSRKDVHDAAGRLRGHIRRTPVVEVDPAEIWATHAAAAAPTEPGGRVILKLEHLQHTGSFKARGALNALLTRDIPREGVVTASGGNHGAAVAWAGDRVGVPVTVFLPSTSPPAKAERIAAHGARLEIVDGYYADAAVAAARFADEHDVTSVHAYDDPAVVAGQGTVGQEVREQVPDASAVLVAVGGGGLVAGVTVACQGGPRTVPVEATRCPTLITALGAGVPVDVQVGGVAADSLGARRAGSIALYTLSAAGAQVHQVSDQQILDAQWFLWDSYRLLTEPGGAAAFAALRSGVYRPRPGDTTVVVICGGNTSGLPGSPEGAAITS